MTIDKTATRDLILFVRSYTDLLEKQLEDSRALMREAVDGVMNSIQAISDKTALKKRQANAVIVNTYTNPDAETKATMDSVQDEVNKVLEEAMNGGGAAASVAAKPARDTDELRNKLRRSAGIFSKHMEALETLDTELQDVLLHMMGMLSRDDVIAQRIEHVTLAMQAMQMSLSYMLVDFETRCNKEGVECLTRDLKSFIMRSYTMEEERRVHFAVFPEDKAKKAS